MNETKLKKLQLLIHLFNLTDEYLRYKDQGITLLQDYENVKDFFNTCELLEAQQKIVIKELKELD